MMVEFVEMEEFTECTKVDDMMFNFFPPFYLFFLSDDDDDDFQVCLFFLLINSFSFLMMKR